MFLYWDEIGYGLGGRNLAYRRRKANTFLTLYRSLKKKGYKGGPVIALKVPLWNSMGFTGGEMLRSPELFHGHHRVACCYVLGIKTVPGLWAKDLAPNSKKWVQKLDSHYTSL